MPAIDIESILGPEPERPPNTTDPAYKDYPQEKKRAWRKYIEAKQQLRLEAASLGYQPEDLGITGEKEQGQAFKRMLEQFGMLDRNYEYRNGMKRNIATSDMDAQARNEWVPMTESDKAEYARHQGGESWRDVWNRMARDNGSGKIDQWARENEGKGGKLRRDEQGRLYDLDDSGNKIFFDNYGVQLDAAGNRTGNIYGGGHMRFGNALGQASMGSRGIGGGGFGGTGGTWGQNTPAAAPTPYYRPRTNPWGSPSLGQNTGISGGIGQSFGSQITQAPQTFNNAPQSTPLRMKRRFGAPA